MNQIYVKVNRRYISLSKTYFALNESLISLNQQYFSLCFSESTKYFIESTGVWVDKIFYSSNIENIQIETYVVNESNGNIIQIILFSHSFNFDFISNKWYMDLMNTFEILNFFYCPKIQKYSVLVGKCMKRQYRLSQK